MNFELDIYLYNPATKKCKV